MEKEKHWVTVLDFTNGKVDIFSYTDEDLESTDGDVEEWLITVKNFASCEIQYMAVDELNLEIHD